VDSICSRGLKALQKKIQCREAKTPDQFSAHLRRGNENVDANTLLTWYTLFDISSDLNKELVDVDTNPLTGDPPSRELLDRIAAKHQTR